MRHGLSKTLVGGLASLLCVVVLAQLSEVRALTRVGESSAEALAFLARAKARLYDPRDHDLLEMEFEIPFCLPDPAVSTITASWEEMESGGIEVASAHVSWKRDESLQIRGSLVEPFPEQLAGLVPERDRAGVVQQAKGQAELLMSWLFGTAIDELTGAGHVSLERVDDEVHIVLHQDSGGAGTDSRLRFTEDAVLLRIEGGKDASGRESTITFTFTDGPFESKIIVALEVKEGFSEVYWGFGYDRPLVKRSRRTGWVNSQTDEAVTKDERVETNVILPTAVRFRMSTGSIGGHFASLGIVRSRDARVRGE